MFCPNCGSPCGETDRFCTKCGTLLCKPAMEPELDSVEPPESAAVPEESLESVPEVPSEETSDTVPAPAPVPQPARKGALWPPLLILALMVLAGFCVFFATGRSTAAQSSEIPWFRVIDNTLYFNASAYTGSSELTVPETLNGQTVKYISANCFVGCTDLTTVILPNTIEDIGPHSFAGCTSLRGIYIPKRVTSIDELAFYGCTSLEAIWIPGDITYIGDGAFDGCWDLTYIFFTGSYQTWRALYSDTIGLDTWVYTGEGAYRHGR